MLLGWIALAQASESFTWHDQTATMRRYARMTAQDPPKPWARSSKGRFRVWRWSGGEVEHFEEWRNGKRIRARWFTPLGESVSTATYQDGELHSIVLHGRTEQTVMVADWPTWTTHNIHFRVPTLPEDDATLVTLPNGTIRFSTQTLDNVFSEATTQALQRACGCVVDDRTTVWLQGRPVAKYRITVPHPVHPKVGEVWFVPVAGDFALVIAAIVDSVNPDAGALAVPRAIVSTITRESKK